MGLNKHKNEQAGFKNQFSTGPIGVSVAPGRVNLIGEHTDYNEGFVLPMNVERTTRSAFGRRGDGLVRVFSEHAGQEAVFPVGEVSGSLPDWARYVANVAAVLGEAGLPVGGADLYIAGDVPVGGGLSSSASLEASVAGALLASAEGASGRGLDDLLGAAQKSRADLALLCQKAEHRVGALCGIMDPFVVLHGAEGHALLIDCRSLETTPVPLDGGMDVVVVVINSRVHHDLAANQYNQRRRECEEAVRGFARHLKGVKTLRDVAAWQWEKHQGKLDPLIARRARHVVTENERTLISMVSFQSGDPVMVGRCMNASHDSLRDAYQVSCRELDLLVEIAQGVEGVYGSRMTGGGFGGCTVTLCQSGAVDRLRAAVCERYEKETHLDPDILVTRAAGPAHIEWPT
ncbi:MAG: galactokinase [Anaerolineaceae bacterium]|nr:galactokinase [Anaerolineaceae bacterium]